MRILFVQENYEEKKTENECKIYEYSTLCFGANSFPVFDFWIFFDRPHESFLVVYLRWQLTRLVGGVAVDYFWKTKQKYFNYSVGDVYEQDLRFGCGNSNKMVRRNCFAISILGTGGSYTEVSDFTELSTTGIVSELSQRLFPKKGPSYRKTIASLYDPFDLHMYNATEKIFLKCCVLKKWQFDFMWRICRNCWNLVHYMHIQGDVQDAPWKNWIRCTLLGINKQIESSRLMQN